MIPSILRLELPRILLQPSYRVTPFLSEQGMSKDSRRLNSWLTCKLSCMDSVNRFTLIQTVPRNSWKQIVQCLKCHSLLRKRTILSSVLLGKYTNNENKFKNKTQKCTSSYIYSLYMTSVCLLDDQVSNVEITLTDPTYYPSLLLSSFPIVCFFIECSCHAYQPNPKKWKKYWDFSVQNAIDTTWQNPSSAFCRLRRFLLGWMIWKSFCLHLIYPSIQMGPKKISVADITLYLFVRRDFIRTCKEFDMYHTHEVYCINKWLIFMYLFLNAYHWHGV